jgi:hypothetical protein
VIAVINDISSRFPSNFIARFEIEKQISFTTVRPFNQGI